MAETLPLAADTGRGLRIPPDAHAIVVVAQDDGAPDGVLTDALHQARFATLQIPLGPVLSTENPSANVHRLTEELIATAAWIGSDSRLSNMRAGIFGSEIAGGAALAAAAARPDVFRALVLRDGRPHLSGSILNEVRAATLLIVNGPAEEAIALNQETMTRVRGIAELEVLSEAPFTHDDPETVAQVVQLARRWFGRFLA
jgi:hypothetical protein